MENGMEGMKNEAALSQKEERFGKDALLIAGAILLASLIIAGAIVAVMEKPLPSKTAVGTKDTAQAPGVPSDTSATTTLDDDPVLGDRKKATVAIVEFSDYECPFCKRFHDETFDKLVKEFVDSGKAVISFRDFPLSFHDPLATKEAAVAECVRKAKGDKAYFAFGKAVYAGTQGGGKGLGEGKLDDLIRNAGADPKAVNACAETEAVKEEIAKDITDGGQAGISGTPSFVIGTLDNEGNVIGERVVGAVPFETFKTAVEKYLE